MNVQLCVHIHMYFCNAHTTMKQSPPLPNTHCSLTVFQFFSMNIALFNGLLWLDWGLFGWFFKLKASF